MDVHKTYCTWKQAYFPKLLLYFFYCSLFGPPGGCREVTDSSNRSSQVYKRTSLCELRTPDSFNPPWHCETLHCFGLLLCPSSSAAFPPPLILQEKSLKINFKKLYLCTQCAGTFTISLMIRRAVFRLCGFTVSHCTKYILYLALMF